MDISGAGVNVRGISLWIWFRQLSQQLVEILKDFTVTVSKKSLVLLNTKQCRSTKLNYLNDSEKFQIEKRISINYLQ